MRAKDFQQVMEQMADYLTARGTGVIEDVLRRTRDFKDWAKSRETV